MAAIFRPARKAYTAIAPVAPVPEWQRRRDDDRAWREKREAEKREESARRDAQTAAWAAEDDALADATLTGDRAAAAEMLCRVNARRGSRAHQIRGYLERCGEHHPRLTLASMVPLLRQEQRRMLVDWIAGDVSRRGSDPLPCGGSHVIEPAVVVELSCDEVVRASRHAVAALAGKDAARSHDLAWGEPGVSMSDANDCAELNYADTADSEHAKHRRYALTILAANLPEGVKP